MLVYTVLRLLAFVVPLGLLLLLPIFRQNWLLAVVFAAIIGLALSILFLRRPLDAVTEDLAERRARRVRAGREGEGNRDEDVEDAVAPNERRPEEGPVGGSGDERPGQQR